jgi:RNA polymerase sigma-70 factor (ECF subfamily)
MGTRAHRGSPADVEALVRDHGEAVRRVVHQLVRHDAQLAEEVVHDALLAAWARREQYRGDAPYRTWLVTIARNRALSALRRVRAHPCEPYDPAKHDPSVDDLELMRLERDVRRALAGFDGLTGRMLCLRLIEGQSYEEIADALGVSLPTVKTRLHRGRRQLAIELAGLGWGPDAA